MKDLKHRFQTAIAAFAGLALLAALTLDGKMRLAVLIFLGGLALRTLIHYKARGIEDENVAAEAAEAAEDHDR